MPPRVARIFTRLRRAARPPENGRSRSSTDTASHQGFLPASVPAAPPHAPVQVVPAAHSCERFPLHSTTHAVVPPHSTVHAVLPPHSAVQPPLGHLMVQLLLPSQVTFEPVSSVTAQVLPPEHDTVLLVPVSSVHWLVPAQLDVQFEPHDPSHTDWPPHFEVQPVPQLRSHVFFDSQLNVALSGGGAAVPPSPPSAPSALPLPDPPNTQLPPALHSQADPVQMQSPVQSGLAPLGSSLPQPTEPAERETPTTSAPSETASHDARSFKTCMGKTSRARSFHEPRPRFHTSRVVTRETGRARRENAWRECQKTAPTS